MAKKKTKSEFSQPMLFDTDTPEADSTPEAPALSNQDPPALSSEPEIREPGANDLIILVDSHSLIYQVFHALPPMTSPHGVEVGAVHGFLRDIATLLQQYSPTYLICAFDASEDTFRNTLYPAYKAHREEMPEALRGQLGIIQDALKLLGIPILSVVGFEADDILATIAHRAQSHGARVLLVTSDKDCRQLITPRVSMLNLRKNELFTAKELMDVWAIRPDQVVDFQSMVGDSTDNVPGVHSIGPKAAQQLLQQFGTLDAIYTNIDKVPGDKKREKLLEHRHEAYLSRDLVRLRIDTPIAEGWESLQRQMPKTTELEELFRELGFRRLAETLLHATTVQSKPEGVSGQVQEPDSEAFRLESPMKRLSAEHYRTVTTYEQLSVLLDSLKQSPYIAIDTETTSTKPQQTDLVGISLCWAPGHAAYLPVLSPDPSSHLSLEQIVSKLAPLMADPQLKWIGQHIKFDAIVLYTHGMPLANIHFDTMVADYLLDAGGRNHDLGDIARRWLGVDSIPIASLIGTGKTQITMDRVPLAKISTYAAEDVDIPIRLYPEMQARLSAEGLEHVMHDLELPLVQVLVRMECLGVRVDTKRLGVLREDFQTRVDTLYEQIMEIAGEKFNPDSPKQLSSILFDKFKLRVVKKTKTGISTDAEVLEELAGEHPLPAKILEYRQMAKLLSTYVEALPELINPRTGRIHTSYRQDIAATGRLSSVEPNLQNIPIRTSEGRSIRSAFVPGIDGWRFMTADYSQIELRVLAHCCGDENLCEAFEKNIDIHAAVAAQVHGVGIEQVTSSMRRSAKAVSFGILYGQSPFGLAKALGISRGEAGEFIDQYFAKYPKVREFIAQTLIDCRRKGFVNTLSGRKRILKGIRDFETLDENKKKQLLEPERMAINTVIQGTAADMIKMAMIAVDRRLQETKLQANMLLQIHDELVFEVAPQQVDAVAQMVRDEMSTVMPLKVPIQVDVKVGDNWAECEPV
ncbi:MAG: DNA polymerase I [Planctomycetota bacterium]|jgi:DNA polymerase-1